MGVHLQLALGEIESELIAARRRRRELDAEIEDLEAERQSLMHAIQRRSTTPPNANWGGVLSAASILLDSSKFKFNLVDSRAGDAFRDTGLVVSSAQVPVSVSPEVRRWRDLPRTEAVATVLADATTPISRRDIAAELRRRGRDGDDDNLISATLAHLSRKNRAVRTSDGWRIAPSDQPELIAAAGD